MLPPPLPPAVGRRTWGLQCSPCKGQVEPAAKEAMLKASPLQSSRRNVLAKGMSRFEVGQEAPTQLDWEQLSPQVITVLGHNPGQATINGTNCYLIGTGRRRLLIDAADAHEGSAAFLASLEECMKACGVEGLDGILITHMHPDHFGNVDNLQERYGPMPVFSGELPANWVDILNGIEEHGLMPHLLGDDGKPTWLPKSGRRAPPLPEGADLSWLNPDRVSHHLGINKGAKLRAMFGHLWHNGFIRMVQQLQQGDYEWRCLRDGDLVHTEGAELVALSTPGHVSDHTSFVLREEHTLFSGDHVLGWGTTQVMDMSDYMESLRRMYDLRPLRLYPGHGPIIEDGVDVLARYIQHRQRREQQVWMALQQRPRPVRTLDLARELYVDTPQDRLWMAKSNIEVLVRKFQKEGAASAWTIFTAADGTESLVPAEIENDYHVRTLPDTILWAARRSMAGICSGTRSKL